MYNKLAQLHIYLCNCHNLVRLPHGKIDKIITITVNCPVIFSISHKYFYDRLTHQADMSPRACCLGIQVFNDAKLKYNYYPDSFNIFHLVLVLYLIFIIQLIFTIHDHDAMF